MSDKRHGVNVISIGDVDLLLTVVSGGDAVHLARSQEPEGRAAVPDHYFHGSRPRRGEAIKSYDQDALRELRWAETTLCGRVWAAMIGGDGGSLSEYREVAYAPTCRRCLTLMDKYFPAPAPDPRLNLVAQLATDIVCEQGFAEVHGVPGDQQVPLRSAIRTMIRKRTGNGTETLYRSGVVHVICDAIYEKHAKRHARAAAEAISELLLGDGVPLTPRTTDHIVQWSAWSSGT